MNVVVAGLGCVAPCGVGAEALYRAGTNGGLGGPTIEDFDVRSHLQMRGLRPLARASLLAAVAAGAALEGMRDAERPERRAVALGTRWGSLEPLFEFERTAAIDGPSLVNPAQFPNVVVNAHAGYLGILFDRAGPNVTLCGPSAGLEAIGHALDLLLLERSDSALAGGVEALGEPLLRAHERAGSEPGEEGAAFLLLASTQAPSPALARVAAYEAGPPDNGGVVEEALGRAGVEWVDVAASWFTGPAPSGGCDRTIVGVSGGAGALAAAGAAATVARTGAPAVAASLPAEGAHVALVLAPA